MIIRFKAMEIRYLELEMIYVSYLLLRLCWNMLSFGINFVEFWSTHGNFTLELHGLCLKPEWTSPQTLPCFRLLASATHYLSVHLCDSLLRKKGLYCMDAWNIEETRRAFTVDPFGNSYRLCFHSLSICISPNYAIAASCRMKPRMLPGLPDSERKNFLFHCLQIHVSGFHPFMIIHTQSSIIRLEDPPQCSICIKRWILHHRAPI